MIGLIGGLALGVIYKIPVSDSLKSVTMGFNATLMVLAWVVSAITGLAFVAAGQLAENQEALIYCIKQDKENVESGVNGEEEPEIVVGTTVK